MLESLLQSPPSSGRFRNMSSSSVSFASANLSSCDIFPEIAGIVSASDSEGDISEYLVRGQDRWHAGDFVFSPPRLKFRRNSAKQPEDPSDVSMTEMLDTLCYTVHDLTHMNGVVENVVLDWQSGAAVRDDHASANEVVHSTGPSCENIDTSSDNSLISGCIATLSEGNFFTIEYSAANCCFIF